jgi:hypothetical protein
LANNLKLIAKIDFSKINTCTFYINCSGEPLKALAKA